MPFAERVGRLALRARGIESRRVPTQHGHLHAYDARGRGILPTTVLLHGIGSAATPFGPVLARLHRKMRRVVAPEYPGHGFSDPASTRLTPEVLIESVSSALNALVDEPAIVVGNSLGGALALHHACAHPEKVRALVLVSPAGAHASEDEWRVIKSRFDIGSRVEARAFLERLYHRPPWFIPLVAGELPASIRRREVRDILESASNEHAVTPEALSSLRMPILLVWGRSERLFPDTHFEYFARHLPKHAVIERPEGFGHCPHFDDPAALAARVVAFARSLGA